ncbi:hypothetical protein GHT06_016944 [Daphnia sinensis]|uniref:Uncharacterized protein n=1 Tax=Daphnia sinensis TaxID=1820382 RepID=A0AAD5KQY9_9CRUS|nr:hypothetical protein GHT06_016944 [Daphnia sinensis]
MPTFLCYSLFTYDIRSLFMLTFSISTFPVYFLETLFVNLEMKSSTLLADLDEHLQLMRISHNQ